MKPLDRRVLRVLAEWDGLDSEGIWLGWLDGYSPEAVRKALQRLLSRRAIYVPPTSRRGFYTITDKGRELLDEVASS